MLHESARPTLIDARRAGYRRDHASCLVSTGKPGQGEIGGCRGCVTVRPKTAISSKSEMANWMGFEPAMPAGACVRTQPDRLRRRKQHRAECSHGQLTEPVRQGRTAGGTLAQPGDRSWQRARLRDGRQVAVKVQRPGVSVQAERDLSFNEDGPEPFERQPQPGRPAKHPPPGRVRTDCRAATRRLGGIAVPPSPSGLRPEPASQTKIA